MKFIMTVRMTGTKEQWDEPLLDAASITEAEHAANGLVNRLNARRSGQSMRELVGVRIGTLEGTQGCAVKGDADYMSPHTGGCWYCNRKEPWEGMVFDSEFDTNVHRGCIKAALAEDPEHPEARLQKYLLEPESADWTAIAPEEMPMHLDNAMNNGGELVLDSGEYIDEIVSFVPSEEDKITLKRWMDNEPGKFGIDGHTDEIIALRKETIERLLDEEIAFAKTCGMPQFTMGLIQAKKVLVDYIDKGVTRDDTE